MTRIREKSLVLYADDDPDDLELMRGWLAPCHAVVELRTFSSASLLLQHLARLAPDEQPALVVLDMNMPKQDGLDAAREIRSMASFGQLPIVLFTTSTMPNEARRADRLKVGFITKPLNEAQKNTVLSAMLDYCEPEFQQRIRDIWNGR